MIVFKGYMKICKRNVWAILLYFIIFYGMAVAMQGAYKSQDVENFAAMKVNIALVDEDGGELSGLLKAYLEDIHKVKEYPADEGILQEEMFYGNIDYILRIPADFEEKSILGEEALKVTAKPGTYSGFYVEQQINSFLNGIKSYKAADFTNEEIKGALKTVETAEIKLVDLSGKGGAESLHSYLFQFLPYIMIAALSYVLSFVLSAFSKKDLNRRMIASAIPRRRQVIESFLAFCVIGLAFWCLCIFSTVVLYGNGFLKDVLLPYYLINSLILLVVSLSIAFLVGMTVKNNTAINGVVNVLSLGMCFLGGTFVPLAALSVSVKKVSQFLPVYWYEVINDLLATAGRLSDSMKTTIYKGYGIQLLFAAACISAALAISRYKRQE